MEVVIITGLSGAGKSQAVNCLEDMGFMHRQHAAALIKTLLALPLQKKT